MKTRLLFLLAIIGAALSAKGQSFDTYFYDRTLRLDYIFAGNSRQQAIYLDQLNVSERWYGRRQRLAELPLQGSGQITMRHHRTGEVIYRHSFSTLFQEWLSTDEAKHTSRSFENVFLVPFPKDSADITVQLYDYHNRLLAEMSHTVSPTDVLIRRLPHTATPYKVLQQPRDTNRCIRIVYIAEGYTQEELPRYLQDCEEANEALFAHEPFKHLRDQFQVIAMLSASKESGVSEPGNGIWRQTALSSHFDTFYMQRYLTTLHLKKMHDLLAGVPYEHIIVLANTEHYGGGGIYNSYNLSYTRGRNFRPVVVHEFGHSFGGLGDEYPYGDNDPMYFSDTEPWEPNLTTLKDFSKKWQNLIDQGKASLVEGGGYLSKGVWRGRNNCRMRTNEEPEFCPVCQQALERLIDFYTK